MTRKLEFSNAQETNQITGTKRRALKTKLYVRKENLNLGRNEHKIFL